MTKENVNPEVLDNTVSAEQAIDAIAGLNPDIVLRNLAFWLDVAIARGRWFDAQTLKENAMFETPDNKESEV